MVYVLRQEKGERSSLEMGDGSCTKETGILKETILEDITDYKGEDKGRY